MKDSRVVIVRSGLDEALRMLHEAQQAMESVEGGGMYQCINPSWARNRIQRVIDGLEASADLLDEAMGRAESGAQS